MSLSDLSARAGLPKPTAYRILNTLESRGYLGRTSQGAYTLARELFHAQNDDPIEQRLNKQHFP